MGDDFRCYSRIQRSWPAGGYTLTRQSTELFVEFHAFLREDGLSSPLERSVTMASVRASTATVLCVLTGGTCSSSSCTVCLSHGGIGRFQGCSQRHGCQFFLRFHSTRLVCGANIDHGVLGVGNDTDAGSVCWKVQNPWELSDVGGRQIHNHHHHDHNHDHNHLIVRPWCRRLESMPSVLPQLLC